MIELKPSARALGAVFAGRYQVVLWLFPSLALLFAACSPSPCPGTTGSGGSGGTSEKCGFDGLQKAAMNQLPPYADAGRGYTAFNSDLICVPLAPSKYDTLSKAQLKLINDGCSAPFYHTSYNTDYGCAAQSRLLDTEYYECQAIGAGTCTAAGLPWFCYNDKYNAFVQLCPAQVAGVPIADRVSALAKMNAKGHCVDSAPCLVPVGTTKAPSCCLTNSTYQISDIKPHVITAGFADPVLPAAPTDYAWVVTWEDPHGCTGGCMKVP